MNEYGLYELIMDILAAFMFVFTLFVAVICLFVLIRYAWPWFRREWRAAYGKKKRKEVHAKPKAKVIPIRDGIYIYNKHRQLVKLGGTRSISK